MSDFGDPRLPDRFWAKVQIEGLWDCWMWQASTFRNGYAQYHGERSNVAHREAYIALVGPVANGLVIDHVCRKKRCVNPQHLEAVTQGENLMRGLLPYVAGEHNSAKTHCISGHEFSPQNTTVTSRGHRRCKTCIAAWSRQSRANRKAGISNPPGRPKGTSCQPTVESEPLKQRSESSST